MSERSGYKSKIIIKEQTTDGNWHRIETTYGQIAENRFLGRGLVVNGSGDMRIDGVEVTASEAPVVFDDVRKTAEKAGYERGLDGVMEASDKTHWMPYGERPKTIETIRNRIRGLVK